MAMAGRRLGLSLAATAKPAEESLVPLLQRSWLHRPQQRRHQLQESAQRSRWTSNLIPRRSRTDLPCLDCSVHQ